MNDSAILDALGGTAAVARRLRVSSASVSEMRKKGIPEGRKIELGAAIEVATSGAVPRWALRPDDWHCIWPELIGSEGAPPVPADPEARAAALAEPGPATPPAAHVPLTLVDRRLIQRLPVDKQARDAG